MDTGKSQKEQSVFDADKKNVITDPGSIESVERRDQYLKRIKKENEIGKVALERIDQWIEIEGKKVIIKSKNRAGSVYSTYFFNGKRYEAELAQLKDRGFWPIPAGDGKGGVRKLELRLENGRPYKKKGSKE